jgi:hypothetical protein
VVTPALNFAGELTVPVTVSDGFNESAPFDLLITVQNVNDAPVISGQAPLSTGENQPITLNVGQLTIRILSSENTNYNVSGQTITPAPGFNGTLSVPVVVSDGPANSNFFNVQIEVTPVNDVPVITGQQALSMPEASSISLVIENLKMPITRSQPTSH